MHLPCPFRATVLHTMCCQLKVSLKFPHKWMNDFVLTQHVLLIPAGLCLRYNVNCKWSCTSAVYSRSYSAVCLHCLPACTPVCHFLWFTCMSVCLSVYLPAHLSFYVSMCLSMCLSVCLSVCLSNGWVDGWIYWPVSLVVLFLHMWTQQNLIDMLNKCSGGFDAM